MRAGCLCVLGVLCVIRLLLPGSPRDETRDRFGRRRLLVEHDLEILEVAAKLSFAQQMIGRRRSPAERALMDRERLVEHDAAWSYGATDGRKEIALEIPRHDDQIESPGGQRIHRQVGAPCGDAGAGIARGVDRIADDVELFIDAERHESGLGERQRVTTPAHRDIERARLIRPGELCDPFRDEWRR
jgi:hypothetical protein